MDDVNHTVPIKLIREFSILTVSNAVSWSHSPRISSAEISIGPCVNLRGVVKPYLSSGYVEGTIFGSNTKSAALKFGTPYLNFLCMYILNYFYSNIILNRVFIIFLGIDKFLKSFSRKVLHNFMC